MPDRYLTTAEAAKHLRLSSRTLETYRARGKGPRFIRMGDVGTSIRYRLADLEAFAAERTHEPAESQ